MATILNGDLTRETTVKVDEREIQLTLTAEQKISMKLKGMKSGTVEIGIGELYHKLAGSESTVTKTVEVGLEPTPSAKGIDLSSYAGDKNMLISVSDFRAAVLIHGFDLDTTNKLDGLLAQFIRDRKQRKGIS